MATALAGIDRHAKRRPGRRPVHGALALRPDRSGRLGRSEPSVREETSRRAAAPSEGRTKNSRDGRRAARREVREGALVPEPIALRDGHYAGAKKLGHGKDYVYSHTAPDGVVDQDYLGIDRQFYTPSPRGWEGEQAQRLAEIRQRIRQARDEQESN